MLELFKTSIENNKGYTSPSGIEELKDTLIAPIRIQIIWSTMLYNYKGQHLIIQRCKNAVIFNGFRIQHHHRIISIIRRPISLSIFKNITQVMRHS